MKAQQTHVAAEPWYIQRTFVFVARANGHAFGAIARETQQPVWRVRAWDARIERRINAAADVAFPPHLPPPVDWKEVAEREARRRVEARSAPPPVVSERMVPCTACGGGGWVPA